MVGKHNVDCVTCWQKTVECQRWHGNRGQDCIMTGLLLRSVECRGRKVLVWRRRANSAASVNVCLEQRLRRLALDSTVGDVVQGATVRRSTAGLLAVMGTTEISFIHWILLCFWMLESVKCGPQKWSTFANWGKTWMGLIMSPFHLHDWCYFSSIRDTLYFNMLFSYLCHVWTWTSVFPFVRPWERVLSWSAPTLVSRRLEISTFGCVGGTTSRDNCVFIFTTHWPFIFGLFGWFVCR